MDILIEEYQESIWAVGLEKGRIESLEIDPPHEEIRWGSIYWAKVTRIDKAQDAAFVNLDGDNQGILYNRDIRYTDTNGIVQKGGEQSIGQILKAGDMIIVQAKSSYIPTTDHEFWDTSENKVVQVSMDITIQGRYLIYAPLMQKNSLSQRIQGKNLRETMELMLENLEDMQGFILRSAAADLQTEIIRREARVLTEVWKQMSAFFTGNTPALIALGPDSIQRVLCDLATYPIDRIEVVTMDHFEQVEDWCTIFAPDLVTKIKPVELEDATRDLALLEYRDILGQIEALFHDYVLMPSGANIIIQETAALTAIDVNSGGDKRAHLSINIDAAKEIIRQMRLRNNGGIVIIDFLKMKKSDEKELISVLQKHAATDPCTIQVHGVTKLGLVELTRKRRTAPLQDRMDGFTF